MVVIVMAIKATHVPSMLISERPGPAQGCRQQAIDAEREIGRDHHFRIVQLPVNLAMTEAVTMRNQPVDGRLGSLVEAADHHGIAVVASASLLQGKLAGPLPEVLARAMVGCTTDAQRAIQFVRSTPGVTTALVGMRRHEHVADTLALARIPPATREAYLQLFEAGSA